MGASPTYEIRLLGLAFASEEVTTCSLLGLMVSAEAFTENAATAKKEKRAQIKFNTLPPWFFLRFTTLKIRAGPVNRIMSHYFY